MGDGNVENLERESDDVASEGASSVKRIEAQDPRLGQTLLPSEVLRTLHSGLKSEGDSERSLRLEAHAKTEPPPFLSTQSSQRYRTVRELGRGGMGRVDEVFDSLLGRPIAQKSALSGADPSLSEMLISEAQTCAQLEHPSIVPVYDLGVDEEGQPFYTMRKIKGRTLSAVLLSLDDPMNRAQLLGVVRQICLAVDFAHSRGVIHRDLKPENVIVGEFGEVYVLDWGIAHVTEASDVQRSMRDSVPGGSPGYMAPEQLTAGDIDARTDVFALGAILYEVLSGARLYDDKDVKSLRERITRQPPPINLVGRGIEGAGPLEALVSMCIQTNPARRPVSARAIADSIDTFLDGERARVEREHEADAYAAQGMAAFDASVALRADAERLAIEAEDALADIPIWESSEVKQPAWDMLLGSRRSAAEGARALARAEAAFARALGRVEKHVVARSGLAMLHFHELLAAEAAKDAERMAQQLDLARAYDDGALAVELRNLGELHVEPSAPVSMVVERYEVDGLLLRPREPREVTAGESIRLEAGSYRLIVRHEHGVMHYPLLISRAIRHVLRLRVPAAREIPEGMILVAGGPSLVPVSPRTKRLREVVLPDVAIGRFPVTLREYAAFLDSQTDQGAYGQSDLERHEGAWRLSAYAVEGDARLRIPPGRELDIPATELSWHDATAYAAWMARTTDRPYRLPTELEWERAASGADGREHPMAISLDASFAKRRESRPEVTQLEVVGSFPLDESPFGVRDLAGGIADWTSTRARAEQAESSAPIYVFRGGSWSTSIAAGGARAEQLATHRAGWVGVRLALSLEDRGTSQLEKQPMGRGD